MTHEEAKAVPTIVTSNIVIQGKRAHALLDSRATHYFISQSFVKNLGILSDRLKEE